jgi:hypothetical protein
MVREHEALSTKVREMEAAAKAAVAPHKDRLDEIERVVLAHLNAIGADSTKVSTDTKNVTLARKLQVQPVICDRAAFNAFVVSNDVPEVFQNRVHTANLLEVLTLMNNGATKPEELKHLPPGIRLDSEYVLSISRRAR